MVGKSLLFFQKNIRDLREKNSRDLQKKQQGLADHITEGGDIGSVGFLL